MKYLLICLIALSGCATPKTAFHVRGVVTDEMAEAFHTKAALIAHQVPKSSVIEIIIDSPGGSVSAGINMIETIKSLQALGYKVNTICAGMCASMAAVLLEFGTERQATSTALIMFHHAYYGNDPSRRDYRLHMIQHTFMEEMAPRMGMTEDALFLAYALFGELWWSAKDALKIHVIDRIVILDI